MDLNKYRQVWIIKYEEDDEKDANRTVDNEDASKYIDDNNVHDQPTAAYREDLAKHKLVWTGNFWADLWFFTKQEHNLLSICLSTPIHPFGRWERFFIELFIFALASMWASSITLYLVTINVEKESVYDNFDNFALYYGYSIFGGLVKTTVNIILKAIATCTCYQQQNTRARVKAELAGYVCMAVWGMISAGLFALGIYFVVLGQRETNESLWIPWIFSLVISYVSGWIIAMVLIFLIYILFYRACMKYDYKFKFDVTYQDYLNWYDEHGEESESRSDEKHEKDFYAVDELNMPLMKDIKPVDKYNI